MSVIRIFQGLPGFPHGRWGPCKSALLFSLPLGLFLGVFSNQSSLNLVPQRIDWPRRVRSGVPDSWSDTDMGRYR